MHSYEYSYPDRQDGGKHSDGSGEIKHRGARHHHMHDALCFVLEGNAFTGALAFFAMTHILVDDECCFFPFSISYQV